jgi:hypothetical protein
VRDQTVHPAASRELFGKVSVGRHNISSEACIMHGIIYLVGLVVVVLAVLSLLGLA